MHGKILLSILITSLLVSAGGVLPQDELETDKRSERLICDTFWSDDVRYLPMIDLYAAGGTQTPTGLLSQTIIRDSLDRVIFSLEEAKRNDLTGRLLKLNSQPVISARDLSQLKHGYQRLLEQLDINAWDLSQFMTVLGSLVLKNSIKNERIEAILPDADHRKFFFNPGSAGYMVFKDNFFSLLKKRPQTPEKHRQLLTLWENNNLQISRFHRPALKSLYDDCLEITRNAFQEKIAAAPVLDDLDYSKLSVWSQFFRKAELEHNFFRPFPLPDEQRDYLYMEWKEYKQTLSFLIGDRRPRPAMARTFLYAASCLRYHFNKKDFPAFLAIRDLQGDCTEIQRLFYEVLSQTGLRPVRGIILKERDAELDHIVTVAEYRGLIFLMDSNLLFDSPSLQEALAVQYQKFSREIMSVSETHMRYYTDPGYTGPIDTQEQSLKSFLL